MKNTIRSISLITMIFTAAILVKTVAVRPFWREHPFATFCAFMLSAVVQLIAGMEDKT